MIRKKFLKTLLGLVLTGVCIPAIGKGSRKIWLLHFAVRGFKYYEGPKIIRHLTAGGRLELVREAENEFDPNAISIHYENQKIGFVPADKNEVLSRLIDARIIGMYCEVIQTNAADPWEAVHAGIYVLEDELRAAA